MNENEPRVDDDSFVKRITSDSDPQVFEGLGEEVEVLFHSQDHGRLLQGTPRTFVVATYPDNPLFNTFTEVGEDLLHPVVLIHRKDKPISPDNFYEPDAIKAKNKIKLIAAAAAVVAAGGLTLLAVKRRKK